MSVESLRTLNRHIVACNDCARLRNHCKTVAERKRAAYSADIYWGKPIPGFGDERAKIVVVGLAPAAHGANRTGRIFTGDRSGDWLYRALNKAGYANQAESHSRTDGLKLRNVYVTCTVKCAPPDNKPNPKEIEHCSTSFLSDELNALKCARVWVALGQIALNALWDLLKKDGLTLPRPKFSHGGKLKLSSDRWLIMSYHPSQQNTFTGRLTEKMFDEIWATARRLAGD